MEYDLDEDLKAAGLLLEQLRVRNGVSQAKLAKLSGLAVRTVRRVEHGKAADVRTYDMLGRAFALPREWFLIAQRLLDPGPWAESGRTSLADLLAQVTATGILLQDTASFVADLAELSAGDPESARRLASGFRLQLDDHLARSRVPRA